MGRSLVLGMLMAAILMIAAAARSDVAQPSPTPTASPPDPHIPNTIGQTDPGPTTALWQYSDLPSGEQAWVDRNRDTTGWEQVNNAFAQAARERGQAAAAFDAATQLGVDDLSTEGCAP